MGSSSSPDDTILMISSKTGSRRDSESIAPAKILFEKLQAKKPNVAYALSILLVVLGTVLSLVYITASSYNPFLYFRF
jgi:hypothetical protein